jgi:hypothetical protein
MSTIVWCSKDGVTCQVRLPGQIDETSPSMIAKLRQDDPHSAGVWLFGELAKAKMDDPDWVCVRPYHIFDVAMDTFGRSHRVTYI